MADIVNGKFICNLHGMASRLQKKCMGQNSENPWALQMHAAQDWPKTKPKMQLFQGH